jgi:hypothetical protein
MNPSVTTAHSTCQGTARTLGCSLAKLLADQSNALDLLSSQLDTLQQALEFILAEPDSTDAAVPCPPDAEPPTSLAGKQVHDNTVRIHRLAAGLGLFTERVNLQ